MLSQKSRYAIRALQHLADRYGQGVVPMAEIVAKQNIPAKFLTVILSELGRDGIVRSQRGRDGGYVLVPAPAEVRIGDVIRLMRGSIALVPCASRDPHEHCENCVPEAECRLRHLMLHVRDETARILDEVTLADRLPLGNLELSAGKP